MNIASVSKVSLATSLATASLVFAQVGSEPAATPTQPPGTPQVTQTPPTAPEPQVKPKRDLEKEMRDIMHGGRRDGKHDLEALTRGARGGDIVQESAADMRRVREINRVTNAEMMQAATRVVGGVSSQTTLDALRKEFENATTPEQRRAVADKLKALEKTIAGDTSAQKMEDKAEQKKEMKGAKQEIKNKRDKMREEMRGPAKQSFLASLNRLSDSRKDLATRLAKQEKRIAELKTAGVDVTEVTKLLETTKTAMAAIPVAIADAQKTIGAIVETNELTKETKDEAGKLVRAAVSTFTKAQVAVAQLARAVKELRPEDKPKTVIPQTKQVETSQ